jgi:hypothetical protein
MTEPRTAAEDANKLRVIADDLRLTGLSWAEVAAGELMRIAGHLDRVATGGDRPAPPGLTDAARVDVGIPPDEDT